MCILLMLNSIERINKVIIMKYFKLFILAKENKEMIFLIIYDQSALKLQVAMKSLPKMIFWVLF